MKKLLQANVAYAIGSVANSAALFLLIPYLVNMLPTNEYGAWTLFEVGILLLSMLILSGMDVGLMREYWFLESEQERQRLVGTVLMSVLVWGGLVTVLASVANWWLKELLFAQESWSVELALMLVASIGFLEAIFGLLLSLLRIREQASQFVLLSFGRMLLFLLVSITGVQLGYGVNGALVGRLVATVIGTVMAAVVTKRYFDLVFDRGYFSRVLRYGIPLLPTNLASYVLFASDRYILNLFSTLEVVAIYSFTYKLATTLDVLVTRPFSLDWAPRRFKIASQPNPGDKYVQALLIYLFMGITFALLILASAEAVYTWFVPSIYRPGLKLIPIILAAYLVYGLSYPLNVGIMLKDRTQYLPYISWLSAAVCLALNWWWIPTYGMIGAAWATLLSYILWTGCIAGISLKLYPIPYPSRKLLAMLLGAVLGYGGIVAIERLWKTTVILLPLLIKVSWVLLVLAALAYFLWGNELRSRIRRHKPAIYKG